VISAKSTTTSISRRRLTRKMYLHVRSERSVAGARSTSDKKLPNCTSSAKVTSTPMSVIGALPSTSYVTLVAPSAAEMTASRITARRSESPW
jgi:hypothetical protein